MDFETSDSRRPVAPESVHACENILVQISEGVRSILIDVVDGKQAVHALPSAQHANSFTACTSVADLGAHGQYQARSSDSVDFAAPHPRHSHPSTARSSAHTWLTLSTEVRNKNTSSDRGEALAWMYS